MQLTIIVDEQAVVGDQQVRIGLIVVHPKLAGPGDEQAALGGAAAAVDLQEPRPQGLDAVPIPFDPTDVVLVDGPELASRPLGPGPAPAEPGSRPTRKACP